MRSKPQHVPHIRGIPCDNLCAFCELQTAEERIEDLEALLKQIKQEADKRFEGGNGQRLLTISELITANGLGG